MSPVPEHSRQFVKIIMLKTLFLPNVYITVHGNSYPNYKQFVNRILCGNR